MQEPAPGDDPIEVNIDAALAANRSAAGSPTSPEPKKGGRSRLHPSNWRLPSFKRGGTSDQSPESTLDTPEPYNPDADSFITPKADSDITESLKYEIRMLEETKNSHGGRPLTYQEWYSEQNSTRMLPKSDDEIDESVSRHFDGLVDRIITARAAPEGPILSSLRATMNGADWDRLIDGLSRRLLLDSRPDDLTDELQKYYQNWTEWMDKSHPPTDVGTEKPVLTQEFQDQLVQELLKNTRNINLSPKKIAEVVGRAWTKLDNTKFIGKPVTDLLVGAGAAFAVKTIAKLAFGGGIGLLAGGGIGAAAGIAKEAVTDYRKQSRELSNADPEFAKKTLKEKLKALDKARMGKAVLRGGIFGFAGGVIGADISHLVTDGHSEIFNWAKDQVGINKPDVLDQGIGTPKWQVTETGGVKHPTSAYVESPKPGVLATPDAKGDLVNIDKYSADVQAIDQSHLKKEWDLQKELNEQANKPPQPGQISPDELKQKLDDAYNKGVDETLIDTQATAKALQDRIDDLQAQLEAAKQAAKVVAPQPPTGVPGAGVVAEAANGIVAPPGMENLPKEVFGLDQVGLHADSNPWNETKAILMTAFDQKPPSDAQVMEITKLICKDSGIKVPEWGLNQGLDAKSLPPGFNLKVTSATKLAIAAMKKGG